MERRKMERSFADDQSEGLLVGIKRDNYAIARHTKSAKSNKGARKVGARTRAKTLVTVYLGA